MIDLRYPRERMLADIGAAPGAAQLRELSDPRAFADFVALDQVQLLTRVRAPQDVLALLDAACSARFSALPREELLRDLLTPLKKALGNAHKRGNRMEPSKWITLEMVVTRAGAFVQVSDEGAGFDVAETCARFAAGAQYFAHHGSGFRKFHKARAVISFADGGRTFRARFNAVTSSASPRAAH